MAHWPVPPQPPGGAGRQGAPSGPCSWQHCPAAISLQVLSPAAQSGLLTCAPVGSWVQLAAADACSQHEHSRLEGEEVVPQPCAACGPAAPGGPACWLPWQLPQPRAQPAQPSAPWSGRSSCACPSCEALPPPGCLQDLRQVACHNSVQAAGCMVTGETGVSRHQLSKASASQVHEPGRGGGRFMAVHHIVWCNIPAHAAHADSQQPD